MPLLSINTDDWSLDSFVDRDGTRFVVEGECETARCGAICCRVADWRGVVGERCEFLLDDLRCKPHATRGIACKPLSCAAWPLRSADVETVNALAERLGFRDRCHLVVKEG